MRYDCDLHCHTVRSDGNDTPQELIENAADCGIKVVAITDHDIKPPLFVSMEKIDIKEYARQKGIEIVLGYEFSCDTYIDDVHILGYRLNWNDSGIAEEVERAKRSKSEAYRMLCEALTHKGIPVNYEKEILQYQDENGDIKYRNPDEVQKKHIFEMIAKKGYAFSWNDAKLIVRDDPALNIHREKINPLDAIHLVKSTGGTAVLAHPFLIDEVVRYPNGTTLTRKEYINKLIDYGLDGIEACYPYDKTSYKGNMTNLQMESLIKKEFTGKIKFFTGGSDYHADFKKGVKNPRYIGEGGIKLEEYKIIKEYLI